MFNGRNYKPFVPSKVKYFHREEIDKLVCLYRISRHQAVNVLHTFNQSELESFESLLCGEWANADDIKLIMLAELEDAY